MRPRVALAKPLLIAAMTGWTLVTAASGCWALGGLPSGGDSPALLSDVMGATSVPTSGTPDHRTLTPGDGTRTARDTTRTAVSGTPSARAATPPVGGTPRGDGGSPTAVPTATTTPTAIPPLPTRPLPTNTPRVQPVPEHAQNASIDRAASELGGVSSARARDAALTPAKGVVVLDPGHGRGDPGAVAFNPDDSPFVLEADSNLRNAVLIRQELEALGYEVYLTRDDAGRPPDGPLVQQFITSDLLWRAQLASAVDADVYLALHGNGATVRSLYGPETWYCGNHEEGPANARLAALVQQATMDALHEFGYFPPNRGIIEDAERHHSGDFCQFVVTRETVVPSALLEFLFLSNDSDARVLADDRSHQVLAKHIASALDQFLVSSRH